MTSTAERVEPSVAVIMKTDSKLKKLNSVPKQQEEQWSQRKKIAAIRSLRSKNLSCEIDAENAIIKDSRVQDVGENELRARIRQLRRTSERREPVNIETARVRTLITQKVAPLQHHRPFSMQPDVESSESSDDDSSKAVIVQPERLEKESLAQRSTAKLHPRAYSTLQRSMKASSVILPKRATSGNNVKDGNVSTKLKSKVAVHPTVPDCNETDELELSGSMIRAQSLRDLTSKFEKMGNPKVRILGPLLRAGEKRYSMMENVADTHGAVSTSDSSTSSAQESNKPTVSRDSLSDLYRRLESCICDLRNERVSRVKGHRANCTDGQHTLLIRLSDLMQKFHHLCAIYAENISPHSKFRYRELLNRMDVFIRQLRQCASSSSTNEVVQAEQHIIPQFEQTIRQIMHLVQR
ncbi:Tyrosine-protein kinase [Dirofilaria immitis]|nr:Tyrosine-protein kinase [Dirofilaria immitis]